ncbi:MAG: hypothetical protein J6Y46_03245 [Prevotella sp.]|nr:hypothetical protein [Prevotella sp.]
MKKVLLLMFLIVSMGANAQSELHKAIKDYVMACPSAIEGTVNNMKQSLTLINKRLIEGYTDQRSEALIKKYCDGPFLDDIIESIMVPCAEGTASPSDFRALEKLMLTPEGKTFQAHQSKINAAGTKLMEQKGAQAMLALMEGKTPQAEKVRQDIPQSYRQLYYKFYDAAKIDDIIAPLLSNAGGDEHKELIQKFTNYLHENLKTLYVNMSYSDFTTADLNFGIKCYSLPEYQRISSIMQKIPSYAKTGTMNFILAYCEWLLTQGVEIKE